MWDQYTTAFLKILSMSTQAEPISTPPTSTVRSTVGKGNEQTPENLNRPVSDAALREYCNKHYHQLLPLIAEKVHQGKAQQDKLKEVKAHLNFEGCSRRNSKIQEVSQHSESRTSNLKGNPKGGEGLDVPVACPKASNQPLTQRVTQSFSPDLEISFPPLGDEDGTDDLMIIEAEIRVPRGLLTLGSSKIIPLECTMVLGPKLESQKDASIADIMNSLSLEGLSTETLELKEGALSHRLSNSNAMGALVDPLSSENLIVIDVNVSSIPPILVAKYDVLDAGIHDEVPHSSKIMFEKENLETIPEHP
nr:reverse transcriptase domain-containing protein [Tanacetum cinerariifolium]